MRAQNLRELDLKTSIDGSTDVARAIEYAAYFRALRVVAMPDQRQELAVIVAEDTLFAAKLGIIFVNHCRPIGEPAKPARGFALDERGIARSPALPRAHVAEEVEHQRTERIVPGIDARAGAVDIDAETPVIGAVLLELIPTARSQRKAAAVVNRTLGDHPHHVLEARIVLITAYA